MAYGDFEDLPKRVPYVKLLSDKAYNIAKNPKYGGYQIGIGSVVYTVFDKKSPDGALTYASSGT